MNAYELGNRLRQVREKAGMTQMQVSVKLGKTCQAVSSFESGRTRVDVETLVFLSKLYGVSLCELLDLKDGNDLSVEERDFLKLYRSATPELREAACAVLRTVQPQPSWKKYVGTKMAARGGDVIVVDEEKAKALDQVAQYLKAFDEQNG